MPKKRQRKIRKPIEVPLPPEKPPPAAVLRGIAGVLRKLADLLSELAGPH